MSDLTIRLHAESESERRVAARLRAIGAVYGVTVTCRGIGSKQSDPDVAVEHVYMNGGPNPSSKKWNRPWIVADRDGFTNTRTGVELDIRTEAIARIAAGMLLLEHAAGASP